MVAAGDNRPPVDPKRSIVDKIIFALITALALWLTSKEMIFDYKDAERSVHVEYKE